MIMNLTERSLSNVRHPEHSEAGSVLFPKISRPSGVEGPGDFSGNIRDGFGVLHGKPVKPFATNGNASFASTAALVVTRSFDSGSKRFFDKTTSPARLAQDDGAVSAQRLPENRP